ncbi:MAG: hypothetical protein QXZ41_05400 [Ignisphaera sp.]
MLAKKITVFSGYLPTHSYILELEVADKQLILVNYVFYSKL